MMKTIRGKLIVYFFVFFFLFYITAISIFVSSNQLTTTYHESFQRFLLLNSISQQSEELYSLTRAFVTESNEKNADAYYTTRKSLIADWKRLGSAFYTIDKIELQNYMNLIDTFIHETELTVGFVMRNDFENYTYHLEETRNASSYIQESTLELINLELTAYQSFYKDMQLRNHSFFLFIIFLFVTSVILAIFFAFWFSNGITRPLKKLSLAAREVSRGELAGEPVEIKSKDELKLLADTFNNMRSNIHGLVEEIKDKSELDRLVKEMELKHLQNQINPHFLFNTLNTLSKMAYLEEARSTSNLIDSVATLLRHSLGDIGGKVALRDEVEVVKDYFLIQKTRFSERIVFKLDIDESCLDVLIPRLTLQPLVENAFIHGIEEKEDGGVISLKIYQSDETVMVEVTDDGAGMEENQIRQLLALSDRSNEHVGHSTGIGLTNVIRRLQLFYQQDHVVEIESEVNRGTTVRLVLPMNDLERVDQIAYSDC
ncbi:histidine kinase [Virgibacillus sp. DJP39]|uniref:sensor histidine kinase n=1 Tax=Virgibacillus sp. DJP39 TaxID=3409790 RepID=UPI003BB4EBA7